MSFLFHVLTACSLHLFGILGLNLIFGKGKLLHFGLGATSIGVAYPLWVLHTQYNFPFVVSSLITLASVVLMTTLFTWLSIRLHADAFGVMTIALHLMFLAIVLNWQTVTRGALGIPQIPRGILPSDPQGFALVVMGVAALWVLFIVLVDRSRIGRALTALAEHPWHGESLGIRRWLVYFVAFFIAIFGVYIGDTFFPPFLHLLSPTDFNFPLTILFVMIIVAGKPGSVWGCVVATFLLTFLKEGLRFISLPADLLGPVRLIMFGLILFAAVWWRRDVLFPQQRSV